MFFYFFPDPEKAPREPTLGEDMKLAEYVLVLWFFVTSIECSRLRHHLDRQHNTTVEAHLPPGG